MKKTNRLVVAVIAATAGAVLIGSAWAQAAADTSPNDDATTNILEGDGTTHP